MVCYAPLTGYYSAEVGESGKRALVFDVRQAWSGVPIRLPCGECIGCRASWARQWAVRCMHEKRMHHLSSFVTLTYRDECLPALRSLKLRDLQLFMKRLRKVRGVGLRFFACGEYGSDTQRPHYHLLLFNCDFPDMRFHGQSDCGESLYTSAELEQLWPYGHNMIGAVDFQSCAYVAGYVFKKVGTFVDYAPREPEFRVMSRRPGIGFTWFQQYMDEAYRADSAIMNGREVPLPRFYDGKFEEIDPVRYEVLRRKRMRLARSHPEEQTRERRLTRERFDQLKAARFKRSDGG